MVRFITLFCFLFYVVSLHGQDRNIFIHCDDTAILKLSQIATDTRLIKIPKDINMIQHVYPSDKYIYLQRLKNVTILDYQGNVIKDITFPDFVTGLTGAPTEQNIYVATVKNIYQYDSKGEEKTYSGINDCRIQAIFYHNNRVWIYSYKEISRDEQNKIVYQFAYLDTESNQIINFPFEYSEPLADVYMCAPCVFSVQNDTLHFALELLKRVENPSGMVNFISKDNKIWKVNNMKAEATIDWSADQDVLPSASGYIGRYRFIQYVLNRKWYVYLTDLTTNQSTCSRGIIDDIYHTGTGTISAPINHNTYYCIKDNNLLIIKVKE